MKKLLVTILALAMAFCMFGCGQEQGPDNNDSQIGEVFTAIPLGGGLGDYEVAKPSGGHEYVKIEAPESLKSDLEGCTTDVYYCADADAEYILVYRWAKEDSSLEEVTKNLSEKYGSGGYQMSEWEINGENHTIGYYNLALMNLEDLNGECYYVDSNVFEDGEEFVELSFLIATEEYELGEGLNQYLWIPKGYEAEYQTEAEDGYDGIYATYDISHYMPDISITNYADDYALETILWNYSYPDGLPFTEEQYNAWTATGWDEASVAAYYDAFDFEIENQKAAEINNCKVYKYSGTYKGKSTTDAYIYVDEENAFNIWMTTDFDPAPWYGSVILSTLHSK